MQKILRLGTRDSALAVWQATLVKNKLAEFNIDSELVFIKSDGDIDVITPLYAMGVQGIFTKTLDAALLSNRIDAAVHSMKDVPVQVAKGIIEAAVLKRASPKDLLVVNGEWEMDNTPGDSLFTSYQAQITIATSSIRRKAQWLYRYPNSIFENLRGNINTRLRKVRESSWQGAIFAAAGLERINLRPSNSIELDWMLPAPAQGAIMVACREEDKETKDACYRLNDEPTEICVTQERNFLKTLMGGCSTPISALAVIDNNELIFKGNIFSPDGKQKLEIELNENLFFAGHKTENIAGTKAAKQLLKMGADKLVESIYNAGK